MVFKLLKIIEKNWIISSNQMSSLSNQSNVDFFRYKFIRFSSQTWTN